MKTHPFVVLLEDPVPAKKPGFALDEHKALGAELHAMRDRLMQVYVDSTHKYPVNSAVARHLAGAFARVDQARSALDESLAREHPAEFDPTIYYPGGGQPAASATFATWLATHAGEDSPVGDLARDALADDEFPSLRPDDRETYENHLLAKGAGDGAIRAFDQAWGHYVRRGA